MNVVSGLQHEVSGVVITNKVTNRSTSKFGHHGRDTTSSHLMSRDRLSEQERSTKRRRLLPPDAAENKKQDHGQSNKPDIRQFEYVTSSRDAIEHWLSECSQVPIEAKRIYISLQPSLEWVDYAPNSVDTTPGEKSPSVAFLTENGPEKSLRENPVVDLTQETNGKARCDGPPELSDEIMTDKRYLVNKSSFMELCKRLNSLVKSTGVSDMTSEEGTTASSPIVSSTSSATSLLPSNSANPITEAALIEKKYGLETNSRTIKQQTMDAARDSSTTPQVSSLSSQQSTPHPKNTRQTPSYNEKQQNINMFLDKSTNFGIYKPTKFSLESTSDEHEWHSYRYGKLSSPDSPIVDPIPRTARKRLPAAKSFAKSTPALFSDSDTYSNQEADLMPRGSRELRPRATVESRGQEINRRWQQQYHDHSFMRHLRRFQIYQDIDIVNEIDFDPPPENVRFIRENVFRGDARTPDPEANYGCSCESNCDANRCSCVAEQLDPEDRADNRGAMPYSSGKLLTREYQKSRVVIHECNSACSCLPSCRNRNISQPQKVSLDIFKTADRGWGLRSRDALRRGQFVDTYRGEILTDAEANARSEKRLSRDVYLFNLNDFASDLPEGEKPYVIDAEFLGSPARFINHSCDPNVGVYGVSLFRGNPRVYELAFFALRDILPGEEIGFDYQGMDRDDERWDDAEAQESQEESTLDCRCGAARCRGQFW